MTNKIKIITLGGAVEVRPDYEKRNGASYADSTLRRIFTGVHEHAEISSSPVANKRDSRDLHDNEKELMLAEIASALDGGATKIVVTTGVETITDLAHMVQHRLPNPACPVIFTGARWPEIHEGQSDGFDNLSLAVTSRLEPGVYVILGKDPKQAGTVNFDSHRMMFVPAEQVAPV